MELAIFKFEISGRKKRKNQIFVDIHGEVLINGWVYNSAKRVKVKDLNLTGGLGDSVG